jgi:hypothetical protein
MRRLALTAAAALLCLGSAGTAQARGFGGFRGGFHYSYHFSPAAFGGYHYGAVGGYHYGVARYGGYHYEGYGRERIDPLRPVRPVDPVRPVGGVGWRTAFDRGRFPTDVGLGRYSAFGVRGFHTAYWSRDYVLTRGRSVRTGFGYYHCFRPVWFAAHPGCWRVARWGEWDYWRRMDWLMLYEWCRLDSYPMSYNYGNNVVYSDDAVFRDGEQLATAPQYAQQATDLATRGQAANAPPTQEWKPLGVFAMTQGDEKTSNNVFELAVNADGVIRGNYYDGVADTTAEVYGQIDKKTQRAAWTIGKSTDRVFEAGAANLTQAESPVLVHLGPDRTQQLLLVRIDPPKDAK